MDRKSVTVQQGILDKSLIKPKTEVRGVMRRV
jgi:hypothetical protein